MAKSEEMERVFGPEGLLATRLPGFEPREAQVEMASEVEAAFTERRRLVIEAATGTGKTLAYLIPALRSARRTVVSTATKNLQDQLVEKDIPLLRQIVDRPFTAVCLKGRQNYLCLHRFERFAAEPRFRAPEDRHHWPTIMAWISKTRTGDRAELESLPDDFATWMDLSTTTEQCLGRECPHYADCFVVKARAAAGAAELIIVNHHLYFADLALRDRDDMGLLPNYDAVVFDEAHHLEETASSFFGTHLSTARVGDLFADTQLTMETAAAHSGEAKEALQEARDAVHGFLQALERAMPGTDQVSDWGELATSEAGVHALLDLPRAEVSLGRLCRAVEGVAVTTETATKLTERIEVLSRDLSNLAGRTLPEMVYVFERRRKGSSLSCFPINVSAIFRERLLPQCETQVFTSATLATDGGFRFFLGRMGLPATTPTRALEPVFHYMEQSLLFVPDGLPEPNDPAFVDKIAPTLRELITITEGRALCLFTSHRNMNRAYDLLRRQVGYRCLVQGEMGRGALLRAFREDLHSVLFATASFWEGVDVQGEALSLVIIDKLPFSSPGDPVVRARSRMIDDAGGNAFSDYQVPSAIVALKQGFGRLIRHRNDTGIVAILDHRLISKSYGKRFINSLPRARRTQDIEVVRAWWQRRNGGAV